MKRLFLNHRGAATLTAVLIIGAAVGFLSLGMVASGLSSRQSTFHQLYSQKAFIELEACQEEALLQLTRNNELTGGQLAIGGYTCTYAIAGSGDTRTLTLSSTNPTYVHSIAADVQLTPVFGILNWNH